ncbi:hypothetical protein CsSME_00002269 [Camellia sinensis var. sinensis]
MKDLLGQNEQVLGSAARSHGARSPHPLSVVVRSVRCAYVCFAEMRLP